MVRHPLRLLALSVALAAAGCDRSPGDRGAAQDYADRENVTAEAAMLEELNAVANIQANVAARIAAEDARRAEEDALLDNALLAVPAVPAENEVGIIVETPQPPAVVAPSARREDIEAAEKAGKPKSSVGDWRRRPSRRKSCV